MTEFAASLFGGMLSVLEARTRSQQLKQSRLWNDAAEQAADAIRQGQPTTGSDMPAVQAVDPTGNPKTAAPSQAAGTPIDLTGNLGGPSLMDDPDLQSMPTPKFMKPLASSKTKSATAADAPKYLPPTKSATAAEEPKPAAATSADTAFDATSGMEGPRQNPWIVDKAAAMFPMQTPPGLSQLGGALGRAFSGGSAQAATTPPIYLPPKDAFGRPQASDNTSRMLKDRK